MHKRYRIRDFDFKLVIMILAISIVGCLAIGSANESLQMKQVYGVIAGSVIMLILAFIDYGQILKLWWLIYLGNLLLLGLVFSPLGTSGGGAQRWLSVGSFTFQPSETAKILLILFFAQFIMKYEDKMKTFRMVASCVILVLIPWLMIAKQPDLSTSIMVLLIFCVIMFVGGISYKLVFGILAVVIPSVVIFLALALSPEDNIVNSVLLKEYQLDRILAFVDPEAYADDEAYQQLNSVTAIASGQLDGKGYRNNEVTSVKNGNFLSEAETDFIFAVIGEEFGFKGSVTVIVLLMGIALECFAVARKARDMAGRIIASGMGGLIAFQTFINMGVATFLLPNTGLPLPFVSSGVTSLMSLYIGMGFVLNVRLNAIRTPDNMVRFSADEFRQLDSVTSSRM